MAVEIIESVSFTTSESSISVAVANVLLAFLASHSQCEPNSNGQNYQYDNWKNHLPDAYTGDGISRWCEEVEEWKKKDPIENLRKYLLENEIASAEELDQIQEEVKEAVEASVKFAEESPFPPLESAFEDIYAD